MTRHLVPAAALAALVLTSPAIASGNGEPVASEWSQSTHSAVRLLAGGRSSDGGFRVGVEIRMTPGFKTYWRVPGDAGVPPSFDWAGSENVGAVALRWPAPARFVDAGVTTIGYKDNVIFPATIRAADAAKGVTVTLNLDYAVCDRICIPAKASVTLKLPEAAKTEHTPRIDAFRAQAPRATEPGKIDARPGLIAATYKADKSRPMVDLTLGFPAGGAVEDVFVEGPDGWHFGAPQDVTRDGERVTLRIPVDERPKNVSGMVPLVATITGAPEASEVRFDLDITPPKP
jgi:DsbC/DsbD-like thiol-disulfide interchange protein